MANHPQAVSLKDKLHFDAVEWGFRLLPYYGHLKGEHLLSPQKSRQILQPYTVYQKPTRSVTLPPYKTPEGISLGAPYGNRRIIKHTDDFVWQIKGSDFKKLPTIARSGNVILEGNQHLNTDFRPIMALLDKQNEVTDHVELAIALWPKGWWAYYDFTAFVLPKIVRIEEAYGPEIFQQAKLIYSRPQSAFEAEFLGMMGIPNEQLIHSRDMEGSVSADSIILANSQHFYFPSPASLDMIRSRFGRFPAHASVNKRRLYLQRNGTRKPLNEEAIFKVLESFDIEIVPDQPRTVAEQLDLFGQAEMVIGPHGSAFTNLLWCAPGTKVMEFFHPRYYPPYFTYLAHLFDQPYMAMFGSDPQNTNYRYHRAYQYNDFVLDPEALSRNLEALLKQPAPVSI